MSAAVALGGWLAASLAAALAVTMWRSLELRMEAVARASHELRGPLTAARLGLELGVRGDQLSPERLHAIDLELGRAALALEDLAGVRERRPAGALTEAVDVRELLRDSVEAWRAAAQAAGVALSLEWGDGPARVSGDRRRLAQATGNLIANAIEHGGGAVAVRGGAQGGRVRIEVLDRGPGLCASVAELVSRPHGGRGRRGRGLAIATAIAEAHRGRLASAPSESGARLVLELPAVEGAPVRAPAAG
jgi:signal transduction histidine kinase